MITIYATTINQSKKEKSIALRLNGLNFLRYTACHKSTLDSLACRLVKNLVSISHALDSRQHLVKGRGCERAIVKPMKAGTKIAIVAAVIAAATARYWFYLAAEVSLPTDRTGFVIVFLSAAALGIYALIKRTSWLGVIPAVFAIVVGAFLPFTVAISEQIVGRDSVIEVGDAMPQFTSINGQGQAFDSSSLNGHLVLIKFFRAHW